MKKFPEKSNWISYKRDLNGTYTVHNHLIDEDIAMTQDEMVLLDKLNGLAKKMLSHYLFMVMI